MAEKSATPMRAIRVDKVIINIGTGASDEHAASAKKLIELVTKAKPTYALARKRIPTFKIAKGTKIGAFVTVRGPRAKELAQKLFTAVDNRVKPSSVTNNTVNFGIHEYIDISGIKYDPSIGMMGMNVNVSFRRPGLRTELKKRASGKVKRSHRTIGRVELVEYLSREFKVEVAGA